MVVDVKEIKEYFEETGIKQKPIAEKTGIGESKLSLVLAGKRKLEAGEYASLCVALGVPMNRFVKPQLPEHRGK
ncbi:MAG: helix-turn-helix transcriptional regulator [Firmicutes bacterium]|nr:helix-turn-helix transcriptional regulator [Bacillota bacterium]